MVSPNHTIQRCPHDKENPYAQINRDLIRDSSISLECRGLIIYLISMKEGFNINIKQIVNHLKGKSGRDKVYKIINEAIEAGYMKRQVLRKSNLYQEVTYFVSETPKFKKILRHPDFQDPENTDDKETISIRDIDKDNVLETIDLAKPCIPETPAKKFQAKSNIGKELVKPKDPKRNITYISSLPKKTLTRSKDQNKTLDAKRRWKLTEEQWQHVQWMKDQGVDSDEATLCYWVKKYSFQRLYDVLEAAKSKPRRSIGAYMNKLLKDDLIVENSIIRSNATFAEDYKNAHQWTELKIGKKYVTIDFGSDKMEIPLSLPIQEFMNQLILKHEIYISRG